MSARTKEAQAMLDSLDNGRIVGIAHSVEIEDAPARHEEPFHVMVGSCTLYQEAPDVVLLTLANTANRHGSAGRLLLEVALLPEVARALAAELLQVAENCSRQGAMSGRHGGSPDL